EFIWRERLFGRADHLATEAEPAVDRADVGELEQRAIGVAMNDATKRAVPPVTDRVGGFLPARVELGCRRHELARGWIVWIGCVDQLGNGRRDRDGVLRGNALQRLALVGVVDKPGLAEFGEAAERFWGGVHGADSSLAPSSKTRRPAPSCPS